MVRPAAFSASRVVAADHAAADARRDRRAPLMVLPPVFGTMLIVGPPTSASPRPPEVVVTISCAFDDVGDVGRHAAAVERRRRCSGRPPACGLRCARPPAPPNTIICGRHLDVRGWRRPDDDAGNQRRPSPPTSAPSASTSAVSLLSRRLPPDALRVDDRRLAGDRDRLRDARRPSCRR